MELETVKTNGTTLFISKDDKEGKINLNDDELIGILECFENNLLPTGRFFYHSCIYQAIWLCLHYVYELPLTLFDIFTSVMYFTNTQSYKNHDLFFDTENENTMRNIMNFAQSGNFKLLLYVISNDKIIIGRKIGNDNAKYEINILAKDDHFELILSLYKNFNKNKLLSNGHKIRKIKLECQRPDTSMDEKIAQELYFTEIDELEKTQKLIKQLLSE